MGWEWVDDMLWLAVVNLPSLPCYCCIKRMTATHLQLSPRSSLMHLALPLGIPFRPVRRAPSHSLVRMHLGWVSPGQAARGSPG